MSTPEKRRRPSSSRPTVTRRLVRSWTRWRQKKKERQQARKQAALTAERARMEQLLQPLLLQALTPVAQAMQRLEERQTETRLLLQHQLATLQTQDPEVREMLLEVLSSLQPTADQVIAQQLGLPLLPRSSPSSGS